jgi:hypothetical protein
MGLLCVWIARYSRLLTSAMLTKQLTNPARMSAYEWESIPSEHKQDKSQSTCFFTPAQAQEFAQDFCA